MTGPSQPKSELLRALYWREEILQVIYWIEGEGFGDEVDAGQLDRFLGLDANLGGGYLDRLVEDGYLRRVDADRYSLTDRGRAHGARSFADEFADLTRPAHGECGPDCWCHASVAEAEACAAERQAVNP